MAFTGMLERLSGMMGAEKNKKEIWADTPRRVVRPYFPPGASRSPSNLRRAFGNSYNIRTFELVYSYKLTFLLAF